MMNLIKVISNELENNKFEKEDKLDKILNNKEISLDEKKQQAVYLLGQIAVAEISNNLWQSYITRPEQPAPESDDNVQGPEQNPQA